MRRETTIAILALQNGMHWTAFAFPRSGFGLAREKGFRSQAEAMGAARLMARQMLRELRDAKDRRDWMQKVREHFGGDR